MTTRAKPTAPAETEPAPDDVQDTTTPPVDYEARTKALEAELAKLRAAAEPKPAKELPPTHTLLLANGNTVETNAPVATHHSTEDGVFAVLSAHPIIPREED